MKNINLGMIKILTGYVTELTGVGNSDILQKNRWKNLRIVAAKYWKGCKEHEEIFSIEYHETYGRTYEIEAETKEEAEEILRDIICNGE